MYVIYSLCVYTMSRQDDDNLHSIPIFTFALHDRRIVFLKLATRKHGALKRKVDIESSDETMSDDDVKNSFHVFFQPFSFQFAGFYK